MPSSEFFGWTLTNLGPLTTTFTAPSSCATKSDNLVWHSPWDLGDTTSTESVRDRWIGQVSCDSPTLGACKPSGEAIDKLASTTGSLIAYHSPGIVCPDGWTTAGIIKGGAEPTGSGVFSKEAMTLWENKGEYQTILLPQLFANALDAQETLAMCCPSGWQAEPLGGDCSSSVGKFDSVPYSTACLQRWNGELSIDTVYVTSYAGKTWNPPLKSEGLITEDPTTSTMTFAPTGTGTRTRVPYNTSEIYLATHTGPVLMVHKEADQTAAKGEDGKGGGSITRASIVLPIVSVLLSLFLGAGIAL